MLLFILGLVIGSFLNCVIYRLEKDQSFISKSPEYPAACSGDEGRKYSKVRFYGREDTPQLAAGSFISGRSFCPSCNHILNWQDLIPLLSFILLKGKCRYCQKRISWQYPAVELATAVVFALVFFFVILNQPQLTITAIAIIISYYLIMASLLIVVFVFDLKHYLIPDEIIYPAIGVAFIYRLFEVCLPAVALAKEGKLSHWNLIENWLLKIENFYPLFNPLISAILAAAFFYAIYALSKGKAMGFGDVKLAFFMGLFLGFPNIIVALFLAFFSGALVGLLLMVFKKKTLKSELPFGPFLISATLFSLFFGQQIINYYFKLFL